MERTIYWLVRKRSPLAPILRQLNPIKSLHPISPTIRLILFSHFIPYIPAAIMPLIYLPSCRYELPRTLSSAAITDFSLWGELVSKTGQFMWDLWWTKWQRDKRLCPRALAFPFQYHSTKAPHAFICHRRSILSSACSVVK